MAQEIKQDVNIGGNLNVNDDLTISASNAAITLNATGATTPRLYFHTDGIRSSEIYGQAGGLMLRNLGATQTNRIDMFDAYTQFDHNVVCSAMGTSTTSLTTKAYVDDGFVSLTATESIAGGKTFTNNPTINAASGNAWVSFDVAGTREALIQGNDSALTLRKAINAGGNNELRIYETYSQFDAPVRGVAPVSNNDLTRKDYVDDNFVDLTTAQTIGGSKIFSNFTKFQASIQAVGDMFIGDGTAANQFPKLIMNGSGTSIIQFTVADVDKGSVTGSSSTTKLTFGTTELFLDASKVVANTVIQGVDPTADTHLTTKAYVDDNFVDLTTNQAIAGAKSFTDNTTIFKATPILSLTDTGTDNPEFRMSSEGVLSMHMYYANASDTVSIIKKDTTGRVGGGASNSISISTSNIKFFSTGSHGYHIIEGAAGNNAYTEWKVDGARRAILSAFGTSTSLSHENGATDTVLTLRNDYADFNKDLRITTMGTAVDSATTKAYVDDNFVDLTSSETIAGFKTFSSSVTIETSSNSDLNVKSAGATTSRVTLTHDNVRSGLLYGDTSSTNLRHYQSDGTTVGSTLTLNETAANFNTRVIGVAPVGGSDLTTRDYVDDNFLKLTGGIVTANTKFSTDSIYLTVESTNTGNAHIQFRSATARRFIMYAANDVNERFTFDLRSTDGTATVNSFIMVDGLTEFRTDVQTTTMGTNVKSLTTKEYVDDNDNVVQQTAGYQFVMPTATPTAGQQLEVGSVVGTTVTMVWV